MTEILELLDWEFKISIINMLRVPMEKVDIMKDGKCKHKDRNSKKEAKGHSRNKKHCNRNGEYF